MLFLLSPEVSSAVEDVTGIEDDDDDDDDVELFFPTRIPGK